MWSGSNMIISGQVPSKQKVWDFSLDESSNQDSPDTESVVRFTVEIWGKAAIGKTFLLLVYTHKHTHAYIKDLFIETLQSAE